MTRNEHAQALLAECERHGITAWVEWSSNHNKLWFVKDGKRQFYVFSNSLSDGRRGLKNSLASLRHVLGVRRIIRKAKGRKRQRNRTDEPTPPDHITLGKDPFDGLHAVAYGMAPPADIRDWIEWRTLCAEHLLRSIR